MFIKLTNLVDNPLIVRADLIRRMEWHEEDYTAIESAHGLYMVLETPDEILALIEGGKPDMGKPITEQNQPLAGIGLTEVQIVEAAHAAENGAYKADRTSQFWIEGAKGVFRYLGAKCPGDE